MMSDKIDERELTCLQTEWGFSFARGLSGLEVKGGQQPAVSWSWGNTHDHAEENRSRHFKATNRTRGTVFKQPIKGVQWIFDNQLYEPCRSFLGPRFKVTGHLKVWTHGSFLNTQFSVCFKKSFFRVSNKSQLQAVDCADLTGEGNVVLL